MSQRSLIPKEIAAEENLNMDLQLSAKEKDLIQVRQGFFNLTKLLGILIFFVDWVMKLLYPRYSKFVSYEVY